MDIELRRAITDIIRTDESSRRVITAIELREDGTGSVTYNQSGVWIDPSAPGFVNGAAAVSDEELVRAYLLTRLSSFYRYPSNPEVLEIERVYKPVGRPIGKGGRIDVVVRRTNSKKAKPSYLFIECKAPGKFDEDFRMIDGQLFRLARQERPIPQYLVYYTAELKAGQVRERIILIDTDSFPTFEDWDKAGQPITDAIPSEYGSAKKRRYANVVEPTADSLPLDRETTPETFNRLRSEIHDVIWGGGGTNNNDVFVYITKLILCKIFDEKETTPSVNYRFQRLGNATAPESPASLVDRLNELYSEAESSYLALPNASEGPAFDTNRISAEKVAYVVGRIEGISLTENIHPGDLLGEFFEQIVSQDFTQTKGQFFTPVRLVRFMLYLCDAATQARETMLNQRDHLGRPRLPYVIDPSCGSGTFLIEYMKLIRARLCERDLVESLPKRIREAHDVWFSGTSGNSWAREYLFGIENNYDLGLASKVNMVLHGDGSMNTWISNALFPFSDYWIEGRHNLLGVQQPNGNHPYTGGRNEQFDLVVSNPPFSVRFSADEKRKIEDAFRVMSAANSEAIFIERWYQLLREGGQLCCVLPEAILDTATNARMRFFLLRYFRIEAVVSLPYDAFRPFTSTKTSIVYATKRSAEEVRSAVELERALAESGELEEHELFARIEAELGWDSDAIFMAEPEEVGYKRRKNLPDLPRVNELYLEDDAAELARIDIKNPSTVLDYFVSNAAKSMPSSKLGFITNVRSIVSRQHSRLDPKYRWLWDYQRGIVFGSEGKARPLRTVLEIVEFPKVKKGELAEETMVIDLEQVESRYAFLREDVPVLDRIGSDKIRFVNCEMAMAKLEPYLAKFLLWPGEDVLGSTEWFGLRRRQNYPLEVLVYVLMLPELCEAYRRLQSGKRHARFDPEEFLDLQVELPSDGLDELLRQISRRRRFILRLRGEETKVRSSIDAYFRPRNEHS